MALNAREYKQESNFDRPDPLEPGSYPGRVVWIISKGLQPQDDYMGEAKPPKHELYVTYELADEFLLDEDGNEIEDKPRFISETFPMNSLDIDLAKSTKRYVALDPSMEYDGDWSMLIGTPCMINITQKESQKKQRIYNNISGISTMRSKEANKLPDLVNEPKVFDIDEPDIEVFLSLPKWLQDDIRNNLEFEGSVLEKKLENHKGDEKIKKEKKQPVKEVKKDENDDEEGDEGGEDW